MKEEEKVLLTDMKERLQAQLHYDDPDRAFDALLCGWAKHYQHGTQWLSAVKKRNWIFMSYARQLESYCGYTMT